MLEIKPAYQDIPQVVRLFDEYTASLGIDLGFQHYDEEVAGLPGDYAPPRGRLYLAWLEDTPIGCVALRPVEGNLCEMKRLYVRPGHRGLKAGKLLVDQILEDARNLGFDSIVLDSLAELTTAIALYKKLGFYEIPPYYHNPIQDAVFLRLDLHA